MRLEQETARRGNAPVVITTVLSLLVVAAAVAAVAWLVLRSPSEAVDRAERLEPVGTALPAPTEQPTLPTPIPTVPSEPAAPGFTGDAPEASGLPTVAAPREAESGPQDAGPTPTPRVVALPTALPATLPPAQPTPLPAPTLPPAVAVEAVPVEALEPVEVVQSAPTAAAEPAGDAPERDSRPEPDEVDDDPFNIFGDGDGNGSRIVPAQNEALERARALQDDDSDDDRGSSDAPGVPVIEPAEAATITEGRDGSMEIVVPDVDAMIDEITAQVTDPDRNPNVGDAGRDEEGDRNRDEDNRNADDGDDERNEGERSSARNRDDDGRSSSPARNRGRSARERIISDRIGRDSNSRSGRDEGIPSIVPGGSGSNEDPTDDCFPFC